MNLCLYAGQHQTELDMNRTPEQTLDILRTLRRNVPIGFSGNAKIYDFAHAITTKLSVPHTQSIAMARMDTLEEAAESLQAWATYASPQELIAGNIERILHETESDHVETWEARFVARVHAAYLMPPEEIVPFFHWQHEKDTLWIPSLANNLAAHIHAGPPIAAFVVAPLLDGLFAASARPKDKGETGVGLPGGKMDPGETARMTAIRETYEEGWAVENVHATPFHIQMDGKFLCAWFLADGPVTQLDDYKEKGRLEAGPATLDELIAGGKGNENAFPKILDATPRAEM